MRRGVSRVLACVPTPPIRSVRAPRITRALLASASFTRDPKAYYPSSSFAPSAALFSTMAAPTDVYALHSVPKEAPVAELKAAEAFSNLSRQEALYALSLARAAWEGAKVTVVQVSPESPGIFSLLRAALGDGDLEAYKTAALAAGATEETWALFITYVATIIDNMGNYKSFGDSKLVPGIPPEQFHLILRAAPSYTSGRRSGLIEELWGAVAGPMYDLSPRKLQLGFGPEDGISTYYSANVTQQDAELVGRWYAAKGLMQPYNTRVFKHAPGPNGVTRYEIRLASSKKEPSSLPYLGVHAFEDVEIEVIQGDYAPLMARVVEHLKQAAVHATNDTEKAMLTNYVRSFQMGDMTAHEDGSIKWVSNIGPVVETYIGFIESYRDPAGTRGEWEGFVAVVNKVTSAKFANLVGNAPRFLSLLPWGPAFEKDRFMAPDFTSLEVLAFAGSGVPAGINIPNYDSVRQVHGFKNVSLGNVLSARDIKERVTFIHESDQELYKKKLSPSFEVQVGLHELLGHGSGKVFCESASGELNFDRAGIADPFTGGPISSWYKPGETWDTVFGGQASTIEECRAEAVGIFLCVDRDVLRIFGHPEDADGEEIIYINWLNMARAGLLALQYYSPKTKSWGQAHMQARYALLRVMLEAGGGLVTLTGLDAAELQEGDSGVHVRMDASKIRSVGIPAVGDFLRRLQVYKSTADVERMTAMYQKYTTVPDDWLRLRDLVIANRRPRQMFVQPVLELAAAPTSRYGTTVKGAAQEDVVLRRFAETPEGIAQAFVARYPETDDEFIALWKAEQPMHAC